MKLLNTVLTIGAIGVTYKIAEALGFVGGSLYLIEKYQGNDKGAFATKVKAISVRLGIKPNWLMAVMDFESGLNPKAVNPISNATGLIQFMPSTANGLGTSVASLYEMSAMKQLDYVEQYLSPYTGKMTSFINTYLAVFYPAAISWSMDKQFPSNVVAVNQIFAKNGIITKNTISDVLKKRYTVVVT